jgi:hypothetical protein
MKRLSALLVLFAATLGAQASGVMPVWEVKEAAGALEKHTQIVDGLLNQYRPEEWVKAGGPAVYVDQFKQARQFNTYLGQRAAGLAREPETLSVVLDVLFRLDHATSLLESVTQGMSLHQNSSVAELVYGAINRNSTIRERLRQYAYQLTLEREKEWEIANREAQRCRETLAKRPPPAPAKKSTPVGPMPPAAAPPKP